VDEAGVADRCEVVGGSFFDSVPAGGDAYILKYVIHDWDEERSVAILRRCREVMAPGAVLLLVEQVVPERLEAVPEARRVTRLDLQMLVLTPGGRERTAEEFRSLLRAAGFELRAVNTTASPFRILEASPA
jgi:hypothetical protein